MSPHQFLNVAGVWTAVFTHDALSLLELLHCALLCQSGQHPPELGNVGVCDGSLVGGLDRVFQGLYGNAHACRHRWRGSHWTDGPLKLPLN